MWLHTVVIVVLLTLVNFICLSWAYKFKTIIEDDEIFSKCENKLDNVLDMKGFLDFSELTITPYFDRVSVSGNATLIWNIQPTDRVQGEIDLFKFDRGVWQPTIYSIKILNFCSIMYDKNQHWYQAWLKYVTNLEEIKDKCFNVPGTKFIHEPFDLTFIQETHLFNFGGHYKMELTLKAFDKMNIMRPTSICFAIRVEYVRI